MATLAEKEAELAAAKEALAAATFAVGYGQGDRSVQRAQLPQLEARVARLAREVEVLQASAAGARSPHVVTPTWM